MVLKAPSSVHVSLPLCNEDYQHVNYWNDVIACVFGRVSCVVFIVRATAGVRCESDLTGELASKLRRMMYEQTPITLKRRVLFSPQCP